MSTAILATKFADKVSERFTTGSLTRIATTEVLNRDFVGAKTVMIYTNDLVKLNDYDAAAAGNRFGTPENLGNTVQELCMTQLKSFSFVIDKTQAVDMPAAVSAANVRLKENIDNVIIPYVDKYNLAKWVSEAGVKKIETAVLDKSNVVEAILSGGEALDNELVPADGRVLFVCPAVYKLIMLSPDFIKQGDLSQKLIARGVVGELDGMSVVKIPNRYWPAGVNFLIVHKSASPMPIKLEEYRVNDKAPGYLGALAEGCLYFDLFVLAAKRGGVFVSVDKNAASLFCATPTATPADGGKLVPGTTSISLACGTAGAVIKYTDDGSDPKTSATAKTYSAAISTTGFSGAFLTVKAFAQKSGVQDSGVLTATYVK